jgi:hypothetical protein
MEGILYTRRRPPEGSLRLLLGSEFDTLLGNKANRRNRVMLRKPRMRPTPNIDDNDGNYENLEKQTNAIANLLSR